MEITKESKDVFSMDAWLEEAKGLDKQNLNGMYLFHIGQVRSVSRAQARHGQITCPVVAMRVKADEKQVEKAKSETLQMNGINFVKVRINEGILKVGDDIMYVLVGGDIRPNVISALESLVGKLKTTCISEEEKT